MQENTYQAVIATDGSETYVVFLYQRISWSRLTTVGFNAGSGFRGYNLFVTFDEILNLPNLSNVGIPGAFYFRVDQNFIMLPGMYVCNNQANLLRDKDSSDLLLYLQCSQLLLPLPFQPP